MALAMKYRWAPLMLILFAVPVTLVRADGEVNPRAEVLAFLEESLKTKAQPSPELEKRFVQFYEQYEVYLPVFRGLWINPPTDGDHFPVENMVYESARWVARFDMAALPVVRDSMVPNRSHRESRFASYSIRHFSPKIIQEIVPEIQKWSAHASSEVIRNFCYAISRLNQKDGDMDLTPFVGMVTNLSESPDAADRIVAVFALRAIGHTSKEGVQALGRMAGDSDPLIARHSIEILREWKELASPAFGILQDHVLSEFARSGILPDAFLAAVAVGSGKRDRAKELLDRLSDAPADNRNLMFLEAIGDRGARATDAQLDELQRVIQDPPNPEYLVAALRALARLPKERHRPRWGQLVISRLENPNPRGKKWALRRFGGGLPGQISDYMVEIRFAAEDALVSMGEKVVSTLASRLVRSVGDEGREKMMGRQSMGSALERILAPLSAEKLDSFWKHPGYGDLLYRRSWETQHPHALQQSFWSDSAWNLSDCRSLVSVMRTSSPTSRNYRDCASGWVQEWIERGGLIREDLLSGFLYGLKRLNHADSARIRLAVHQSMMEVRVLRDRSNRFLSSDDYVDARERLDSEDSIVRQFAWETIAWIDPGTIVAHLELNARLKHENSAFRVRLRGGDTSTIFLPPVLDALLKDPKRSWINEVTVGLIYDQVWGHGYRDRLFEGAEAPLKRLPADSSVLETLRRRMLRSLERRVYQEVSSVKDLNGLLIDRIELRDYVDLVKLQLSGSGNRDDQAELMESFFGLLLGEVSDSVDADAERARLKVILNWISNDHEWRTALKAYLDDFGGKELFAKLKDADDALVEIWIDDFGLGQVVRGSDLRKWTAEDKKRVQVIRRMKLMRIVILLEELG